MSGGAGGEKEKSQNAMSPRAARVAMSKKKGRSSVPSPCQPVETNLGKRESGDRLPCLKVEIKGLNRNKGAKSVYGYPLSFPPVPRHDPPESVDKQVAPDVCRLFETNVNVPL